MNIVEFYLQDLETKFNKIDFNDYYLSYSGGKDSHFLYWFIKEYLKDDRIEIVGVNTYMEHEEIRERIYTNSDKVLLPKKKPFEIKEKYGTPTFSKTQDEWIKRWQRSRLKGEIPSENTSKYFYGKEKSTFNVSSKNRNLVLNKCDYMISNDCCKYLKKEPLLRHAKETGKKSIQGLRSAEGVQRKSTTCFTKKGFFPIHDLTDDIINQIYNYFEIPIPNVYNYLDRTGCMACIYGKNIKTEYNLLNENKKKYVKEYFKESLNLRDIILIDNEPIKKKVQLKLELY